MTRDWGAILKAIAPKADARFVASFAAVADRQFGGRGWLNDTALAGVLAHMAHETMGFTKFVENMSYSAPRICAVWPSRFPNVNAAMPYARNPEKLANKVYANRMGNGPPETGDGWRYRGGGGLQHTGKAEYERVKRSTGYNQDEVRDAGRAEAILAAALSYCEARKVTSALSSGDMNGSTKLINGGLIGLEDRKVYYRRAKAALSGNPVNRAAERTRTEQRDTAKTQSKVVAGGAGTVAVGTGTATTVAPPPAAVKPAQGLSNEALAFIALGVALALAGIAYALWRYGDKLQTLILKDQAETAEARANDP